VKQRRNQLVAIECSTFRPGEDDPALRRFMTLRPIILAGGPHTETNRRAMIENMVRIFGGEWSARVVYRWRSKAHLMRSIARGGKWRGGAS
jgi:hypothetical protein